MNEERSNMLDTQAHILFHYLGLIMPSSYRMVKGYNTFFFFLTISTASSMKPFIIKDVKLHPCKRMATVLGLL